MTDTMTNRKVRLTLDNWLGLLSLVFFSCGSVVYTVHTYTISTESRITAIEQDTRNTGKQIDELRFDVRSLRDHVMAMQNHEDSNG